MTPVPDCPFCGRQNRAVISAPLYRCAGCGIIFNADHKSLSYDRDYFIAGYREQYGKTYIEDYENIYRMAQARLDRILRNLKQAHGLSLLDLGCAAGFFLKAAKDRGIADLLGIEVSEFAADYCRRTFGIDVINTGFNEAGVQRKFYVISSWFFLEHMEDPRAAVNRIFSMLEDGGVFVCGIPSYFGPSFSFDREGWVKTHPADHRFDLSPSSAKKLLKKAGFRRVKVYRSGYHPERVVKKDSWLYPLFEPLYNVFSSLTAYSDTIEIYAVK
ncbi:MAG TPA: class I SAM-dependent methyltransferase [Spirochaetota bacterium]|nr:class I SAM-dependent methyltransferase [Spirochaetota bacterium]